MAIFLFYDPTVTPSSLPAWDAHLPDDTALPLTVPAGFAYLQVPDPLPGGLIDYDEVAALARQHKPTLIIAHNKTLAAQLYSEFREFFPRNAVEYFVSYYDYFQPEAYVPQRDLFIEKDSSINEHIEQMRLSATKSLMERRDVVIVATLLLRGPPKTPASVHRRLWRRGRHRPCPSRAR